MNIQQYRAALRCVDAFMADDPMPGTDMGDALDALSKLCEDYEKVAFPFERPSEAALAEFRRLERGL